MAAVWPSLVARFPLLLMDYWNRKACLVTGGTSGLGRVLAETLVRRGARVVVNGRDRLRLANSVAALKDLGGEASGVMGDVTQYGFARELVADTVELLAGLDFVCHAAGRSMRGELVCTSREDFEALWQINTRAAFDLACAAADPLTATRGHLVLVGSLASRVAPGSSAPTAKASFHWPPSPSSCVWSVARRDCTRCWSAPARSPDSTTNLPTATPLPNKDCPKPPRGPAAAPRSAKSTRIGFPPRFSMRASPANRS